MPPDHQRIAQRIMSDRSLPDSIEIETLEQLIGLEPVPTDVQARLDWDAVPEKYPQALRDLIEGKLLLAQDEDEDAQPYPRTAAERTDAYKRVFDELKSEVQFYDREEIAEFLRLELEEVRETVAEHVQEKAQEQAEDLYESASADVTAWYTANPEWVGNAGLQEAAQSILASNPDMEIGEAMDAGARLVEVAVQRSDPNDTLNIAQRAMDGLGMDVAFVDEEADRAYVLGETKDPIAAAADALPTNEDGEVDLDAAEQTGFFAEERKKIDQAAEAALKAQETEEADLARSISREMKLRESPQSVKDFLDSEGVEVE